MSWFLVKRNSDGKFFSIERNKDRYKFETSLIGTDYLLVNQFPYIYVDIWKDFYNGKIDRKELNRQLDCW